MFFVLVRTCDIMLLRKHQVCAIRATIQAKVTDFHGKRVAIHFLFSLPSTIVQWHFVFRAFYNFGCDKLLSFLDCRANTTGCSSLLSIFTKCLSMIKSWCSGKQTASGEISPTIQSEKSFNFAKEKLKVHYYLWILGMRQKSNLVPAGIMSRSLKAGRQNHGKVCIAGFEEHVSKSVSAYLSLPVFLSFFRACKKEISPSWVNKISNQLHTGS